MKSETKTANRNVAMAVVRKPYSKPQLRCFGAVGALTQAGTGTRSELMTNNNCSSSPNQQSNPMC